MSCALSGKNRHTANPSPLLSPVGKGSKTGLVVRRPFAFCCEAATWHQKIIDYSDKRAD